MTGAMEHNRTYHLLESIFLLITVTGCNVVVGLWVWHLANALFALFASGSSG